MITPVRNLAKPFSIAGFFVGETIMVFTVLAPNMKGSIPVPWDVSMMRIISGSIFFGPFGAAAGLGVGLLVSGLVASLRRSRPAEPIEPESR